MNWFLTQLRHDWQRFDSFEQLMLCVCFVAASTTFTVVLQLV